MPDGRTSPPGLPYVRVLCEALEQSGFDPVVMRRAEVAGEGGWDSDVDLAIPRSALDRATAIAGGIAREAGGRVLLVYRGPGSRHVVVQPGEGFPSTFVLPIHLQDGVRQGTTLLIPGHELRRERRKVDGLWRPGSDLEAASLLLNNLAARREVTSADRALIFSLCQDDPARLRPWCVPFGIDPIRALAQVGDGTAEVAYGLGRNIVRRAILRRPFRYLADGLAAALSTAGLLLRRRGALIAFVGPDGAGKSTLIEELDQLLAETGMPRRLVYFGVRGALLPTKRWLRSAHQARRRATSEPQEPAAPVRSKAGQLAVFLGTCHSLLDQWLRYAVHVRPALARARVVLADRYLYDAVAAPAPFGLDRVVAWLVCRLAPRPDLAVVLTDEAGRIHGRKPELTIEEIERQMRCYRRLEAGPARCRVVDGGISAPQRALELLPHVLDAYARRNG